MKIRKTASALILTVIVLLMLISAPAVPICAAAGTAKIEPKATFIGNDSVRVNTTFLASGYVRVAYLDGGDKRIKVTIAAPNSVQYKYDLDKNGKFETFPLSEGDGSYSITVYKNTTGNAYSTVYTVSVDVKLKNPFAPFLVSNQYVNYTPSSKSAARAADLTKDKPDEIAKITAIYKYVISNLKYDTDKAKKIVSGELSGYVPDVDEVITAKKGICFDYAALMTAMARCQGMPCKLVIGYAGDAYHAWISIYTEESGWIDNIISFDGEAWKLMDPTFASTGRSSSSVMKFIGDGSNYSAKYQY